MAIRSPPAGPIPAESPRFCVCNLGSDGVGGAVTPETLLLLLISIFIRRHLITSSSDLHFAASMSLTDQLKSHVSRVRIRGKGHDVCQTIPQLLVDSKRSEGGAAAVAMLMMSPRYYLQG